jgi:HK97 family phage major capsid protein
MSISNVDAVVEAVGRNLQMMRDDFREDLRTRDNRANLAMKALDGRISATKEIAISAARGRGKGQPSAQTVLVRSILARSLAAIRKQSPHAIAESIYGKPDRLAEAIRNPGAFVAKAAVSPAQTTVSNWAAELVGPERNYGLIASIAPASIYAALLSRGISTSLAGVAGIRFTSRPKPTDVPSIWVGEGAPIPCRSLDFDNGLLAPKKAAVLSLLTDELNRHSIPAAEAVIRQALSDDVSVQIDTALLDANPATALRPAGLLNSALSITASTSTDPATAAAADIAALISAITPAALRPVLIAGSAQAINLAMLLPGSAAIDILITDALPAGTVVAVDAADFAGVADNGGIDVSDEASVISKTDPLPVSTGSSGAGAITDAPHISTWQQLLITIRLIEDISWIMRRPNRVSAVEDVTW